MVDLFKSELLGAAGFPVHGYTRRSGGVSEGPYGSLNLAFDVGDDPAAVKENLDRLRREIGAEVPLARVVQVHGNRVVSADEALDGAGSSWEEPGRVEADGIVRRGPGAVLAVQNADCAPVLLADPSTGAVGAVHAGWRGAAKRVLLAGVRAMIELGAVPGGLLAAIGPCACAECYEVGEEVARHFPESADPVKGVPGKFMLDLGLAVEVSLLGAGLRGENIDRLNVCSIHSGETFSVRRDGSPTGRFIGFIQSK